MPGFILRWILNTIALFIVATIFGYDYASVVWLFVASAVLGFLNAVVKPILFWLTLPLTIVTLGLFLIVLNALMLLLTDFLLGANFEVGGFWPAAFGAIVLGLISLVTNRVGRDKKDKD
jgi:putative membrane protein